MKPKLIIAAVALILMSGCGNKNSETSVNNERDSLMAIISERDASLNEFLDASNEIKANLDSIVMRQGSIMKAEGHGGEVNASTRDHINADIAAINELMKRNRERINSLSSKLKSANSKLAENDKLIQTLYDRLTEKDSELACLNDQLIALNIKVTNLETSVNNLSAQNTAQGETIAKQTEAMHTAYYAVGKSSELRDKKIISKTGGLLGIGKTSQLEPNIDNSKFVQIDYTQVEVISVNSSNPKIITSHPSDSYKFDKQKNKVTGLHITDPEKFWSVSKYLVIVTD